MLRPSLGASWVRVAVLKCRVRSTDPKMYRHFKAAIAVCNIIAWVGLDDLPEGVRGELMVKGAVTYTTIPEFLKSVSGLGSFKEGVDYLRLVLEG